MERASEGDGQVILLTAEPGIKTLEAVLAVLLAMAAGQPVRFIVAWPVDCQPSGPS